VRLLRWVLGRVQGQLLLVRKEQEWARQERLLVQQERLREPMERLPLEQLAR